MVTMVSAENHQFQLGLELFMSENKDILNKNKKKLLFEIFNDFQFPHFIANVKRTKKRNKSFHVMCTEIDV